MTSVLASDLMTNGDFINVVSLYDDGRRQGFIQHFKTGGGISKNQGVSLSHTDIPVTYLLTSLLSLCVSSPHQI